MFYIRTPSSEPPCEPDAGPLALKNAHPRDRLVSFRAEDHVYFLFHETSKTYLRLCKSVSGLYKKYFNEFDSENISLAVVKKRKNDRYSPYYWLIRAQEDPDDDEAVAAAIRNAWDRDGNRCADRGTKAHATLEDVMNDCVAGTWSHRLGQEYTEALEKAGMAWVEHKMRDDGWKPYRAEWSIFIDGATVHESEDGDFIEHHDRFIAGQLDALFVDENGRFHMVDWKFCGAEKLHKNSGEFKGKVPMGLGPLSDVPDNSYGHYLAQQSIYAFILRKRYGIDVASSRLVHIPSDVQDPVAREIPLELISDEVLMRLF